MSVSVVNGFTCFSGCDEAKARRGEDPHPKQGADAANGHEKAGDPRKDASRLDGPAVTFGGNLSTVARANSPDAVAPATATQEAGVAGTSAPSAVDLLV